jgi:phage terminase large subunit-like protein
VTVDASVLSRLDDKQARFLVWQKRWGKTARPNQVPEVAAKLQGKDPQFTECGYLAGRGYGKTRVGAEWLARKVFLVHQGSTAR